MNATVLTQQLEACEKVSDERKSLLDLLAHVTAEIRHNEPKTGSSKEQPPEAYLSGAGRQGRRNAPRLGTMAKDTQVYNNRKPCYNKNSMQYIAPTRRFSVS